MITVLPKNEILKGMRHFEDKRAAFIGFCVGTQIIHSYKIRLWFSPFLEYSDIVWDFCLLFSWETDH